MGDESEYHHRRPWNNGVHFLMSVGQESIRLLLHPFHTPTQGGSKAWALILDGLIRRDRQIVMGFYCSSRLEELQSGDGCTSPTNSKKKMSTNH